MLAQSLEIGEELLTKVQELIDHMDTSINIAKVQKQNTATLTNLKRPITVLSDNEIVQLNNKSKTVTTQLVTSQ